MALSRWSVRLSLDEGEAGPISSVVNAAFRPEIHGMSIGRGPLDEPDEPGTFTIEVDGANANDARVRCQHILGELQRVAGLSRRLAPAVWVAPLSDDHPSSLRFLSEAEYLVGDKRYEMAVVASQIHLEIQVRVLVETAIEAGSEKTLALILRERPAWSPHDRIVEAILDALLGVRVKDYPGWGDYMAHVSVAEPSSTEDRRLTRSRQERPSTLCRASGSGSTPKHGRARNSKNAACATRASGNRQFSYLHLAASHVEIVARLARSKLGDLVRDDYAYNTEQNPRSDECARASRNPRDDGRHKPHNPKYERERERQGDEGDRKEQ